MVLVLGMHRSSTSMLARAVGRLGVPLGGRLLDAPRPDNALGYAEHAPIVALQEGLIRDLVGDSLGPGVVRGLPRGWPDSAEARAAAAGIEAALAEDLAATGGLIAVKDPRTALLLPLWRRVLARLGAEARPLLIHRQPREVAASLLARNGLPPALGEALWLRHHAEVLRHAGAGLRHVLGYEATVADPAGGLGALARALGLPPPAAEQGVVADLVRPGLRHQDRGGRPAVLAPAERLHGLLCGTPPARLAAAARPALDRFESLLRALDATAPGWLAHALSYAGPGRPPLRLALPFPPEAAGATELTAPLPGAEGATVALRHGNPWSVAVEHGFQLHANPPGAPAPRLEVRGLPGLGGDGGGGPAFAATLQTPEGAPPMLLRVALREAAADGAALGGADLPLGPGAAEAVRVRFAAPPGGRAAALAIELSLAEAGATTNERALVRLLAPRLEAEGDG